MMQPEHQLYSYSYLYRITSTSPSFIHKMIGLFVSSLDEYVSELELLLQSKNLQELKKVLHKMKPSMMNLEIKGAGEILSKVSESGTWTTTTSDNIRQLRDTLKEIKPLMEQDLHELSKEVS
ncbi:Hpt protein [Chitinophaga pinensis DSM 2588]|uniref:Hpt protein n=2 Tax=Chitinophaga pinensis TaxID=79329 RepID=A0A979GVL7_CHIPD|nr:Hpt protein [Chitinophaga pinensis DSM 2588]